MEVICSQDEAFYQLVEDVVDRLKEKKNITQDKCISPELAMEILNIKNKTTLQKLLDAGRITFTQPQKKIILYDYDSIIKCLNNHSKKSF